MDKWALTWHFDMTPRAYHLAASYQTPCRCGQAELRGVGTISTGVLILSYTEFVQQPVRDRGSGIKNGRTGGRLARSCGGLGGHGI
jgi:hypothetical protein